MDPEEIVNLRLASPFRPFKLILRDGRELLVDKSYYLAIAPDRRFMLWSSLDGAFEKVESGAVARAVLVSAKSTNGRKTKRRR
jgi:hypothetical protein